MRIEYHAPFSINQYLKDLVIEKLEKLDNLNLKILETDVYFKLKEGSEAINDKELEIKIHLPGQMLFAKSNADTFEKAIPLASEKIRKQIVKYKKSLESKRRVKKM